MKFTLDGSFTTLNDYIKAERSSKFAAADIKRIETTRVMWLCKEIGIKKITTPVKIKFTWFTKDERIDPDNTSFSKKFILDGMVLAGILTDDSRKWIKGFEDKFNMSKKPRVEIDVTEVE